MHLKQSIKLTTLLSLHMQ